VNPSADDQQTAVDASPAEPPRSWLAVAELLEQHGFGELTALADDDVDPAEGDLRRL
jgi:hypothetical protein